ncbi:hypothetical protein DFO55_12453 [Grimontella sp. AG753]|nr:hypothetical protein DFO55_12453 [Grimontella sp. AG753]
MKTNEMVSEVCKDVENRIDFVVSRFRTNAGPEYYSYRLRYIDDLIVNSDPLSKVFGTFMGVFFLVSFVMKGHYFYAVIFCITLAFVGLALRFARGRILKEKDWKGDYVSDGDILYMCENGLLKNIICDYLEDGRLLTYSELDSRKESFIELAISGDKRKKREDLLSQIQQMENHKQTTNTERA